MSNHPSTKIWDKLVGLGRGPFLLTKAYFDILQKDKVLSFLKSSPFFKIEKQKKGDCLATWVGKDTKSILGILKINKAKCVLECISKDKVEEGKKLLEKYLKEAINFRAYSLQKIEEDIPEESDDEQILSLEDYLQYYYENEWIKAPLPALGGKTPLECLKSCQDRAKLLELINQLEKKSNLPYDFNRLRCRLKLGCIYDMRVELEKYKLALQEQILVFLDASFRLLRAVEKVGILPSKESDILVKASQLVDELTNFVVALDEVTAFREYKRIEKEIVKRFDSIEDNLLLFLNSLPQQEEIMSLYLDENWDHLKEASEDFFIPLPHAIAREIMANWRESAEEILVTPQMDLKTLLKKQPIEWIEAISTFLGLSLSNQSKNDHIQVVCKQLHDQKKLKEVVKGLEPEARKLLRLVLDTGGVFPYACLVKCFGNDAQDGFYWREKPPQSIIGILRSRGLLFVGHIVTEGKKLKVALIPHDLRPSLFKVL